MPHRDPEEHKKCKQDWYRKNKDYVKGRAKERSDGIRAWLKEYKSTLSCEKCGEDHPACLEFHHRDPSEKEIAIVRTPNNGWSKKRILAEMAKCEVLCSNCHRKLHCEV